MHPKLVWTSCGAWPCAVHLPQSTTGAHHPCHRGKLSVLNASSLAGCLSMECQSIDQMWPMELCWPWSPSRGMWWLSPGWARALPCCGDSCSASGCSHRPKTMGLLRVEGIATPEVKFLDRCTTNCSEGVLQVHVRRSRMKVWGAKMIRHRRSPQL